VPEVAACGRSEGSDGHTPLPKRGPHLRKRTPPAAAGAAAAQAPRVRVHSGRTWWHRRQGPQQHTVAPSREEPTEQNRSSIDRARPRLQPPVPTSDSSPALPRPPSASPRWSTHRSHNTYQSTHHTRPGPVAAAPPPAHQHPPGQTRPTFTWHVEEGGPAQRAGPPFSKAQAGSERSTRGRGGGPFALKTNP
jgi:hypothetical protein